MSGTTICFGRLVLATNRVLLVEFCQKCGDQKTAHNTDSSSRLLEHHLPIKQKQQEGKQPRHHERFLCFQLSHLPEQQSRLCYQQRQRGESTSPSALRASTYSTTSSSTTQPFLSVSHQRSLLASCGRLCHSSRLCGGPLGRSHQDL